MCHFAKACMFFLIALVASAWAFQCYVCNSKNDTGCDSPPREEYLKTCEDLHYSNHGSQAFTVCRLQVINSENKGVIYDRRCGWIKHNENRETCTLTADPLLKATNCECHTDRCNGSLTTAGYSSIVFVVACLFVAFLQRQ